jgi:plastocyanin
MNCKACGIASAHLKNPKSEPSDSNPIVHWTLNKGPAGLDEPGDSLAIFPQGSHKSISAKVSAAPGTTLYFLCALHPWMQGKIVVK